MIDCGEEDGKKRDVGEGDWLSGCLANGSDKFRGKSEEK